MNTYCLRHTPVTIGLGLTLLLIGSGALLSDVVFYSGDGAFGASGVILVLGSLLVAVWPNVPRLALQADAFVVRGFLNGSSRAYSWDSILSITPDEPLHDVGFDVVTTKGRVHIRKSLAGLSEVRRLFDRIAKDPANAEMILTDDYCDKGSPITLRRNWQMGICPVLTIPVSIGFLTELSSDTWSKTLFWLFLLGSALLAGVLYTYQFFRTPYRVNLEGTTLTILRFVGKVQHNLTEISAMDLVRGVDSEQVRIRAIDGSTTVVRLKDFFGYPAFDRAFYTILLRWQKSRTVENE